MSRLKGEINSEERQALEAKVVELKKTLEEKKSTFVILETEIKKLNVTYTKYILCFRYSSHWSFCFKSTCL